jgi:hypothetical protein
MFYRFRGKWVGEMDKGWTPPARLICEKGLFLSDILLNRKKRIATKCTKGTIRNLKPKGDKWKFELKKKCWIYAIGSGKPHWNCIPFLSTGILRRFRKMDWRIDFARRE